MKRALIAVIVGYGVWSGLWVGGNAGLARAFPDQVHAFQEGTSITATGYLVGALASSRCA